ncbi:hypothetical protein ACOTHJ_13955 [Achromobacter xylosoxidans]
MLVSRKGLKFLDVAPTPSFSLRVAIGAQELEVGTQVIPEITIDVINLKGQWASIPDWFDSTACTHVRPSNLEKQPCEHTASWPICTFREPLQT